MSGERVLVVDDEEGIRTFIAAVLKGQGMAVTQASDGDEAAAILDKRTFHLVLSDLKMPGRDGMAILGKVRAEHPGTEVIILTAHGTVENAVQAMKLGAFDYLSKPLSSPAELRLVVARALERRRLLGQEQLASADAERGAVPASDPVMVAVESQLDRVAVTETTVLLLGESGVGKEVAARRIHERSPRRERPFVAVNCATLTSEMLQSELFGHEKGAFTGAVSRRRGRFELADGGTLFLDEIGELDPALQGRLLRVLQERSFERLGGSRTIEADVRLVAATNRDLLGAVEAGTFRRDLYHRIAVFPIEIPALRDRPGDIAPLAQSLLRDASVRVGRSGLRLADASARALEGYDWPGNIRELENVIERAAILAGPSGEIEPSDLGPLRPHASGPNESALLDGTLAEIERAAIQRALDAADGHRRRAASKLGIGLRTLYTKLKEYGLG